MKTPRSIGGEGVHRGSSPTDEKSASSDREKVRRREHRPNFPHAALLPHDGGVGSAVRGARDEEAFSNGPRTKQPPSELVRGQ